MPNKRCGARLRNKPGRFCRCWANGPAPLRGGERRCRLHTGQANHHPTGRKYQWQGRNKKQAVLRELGLPWYGGRRKSEVTLTGARKAIAIMDDILEQLPVPRTDVPDSQKGDIEIFSEGVRASCILLRNAVLLGDRLMRDEKGELLNSVKDMHPQDLKMLGMAQITALGITKQGFKAVDRAKRTDMIGKLLDAIAAERAQGSPHSAIVDEGSAGAENALPAPSGLPGRF